MDPDAMLAELDGLSPEDQKQRFLQLLAANEQRYQAAEQRTMQLQFETGQQARQLQELQVQQQQVQQFLQQQQQQLQQQPAAGADALAAATAQAVQASINQAFQQQSELQQRQQKLPMPQLPLPKPWDGKESSVTGFQVPMGAWLVAQQLYNSVQCVHWSISILPAHLKQHFGQLITSAPALLPQNFPALMDEIRARHPEPDRLLVTMDRLDKLHQKQDDLPGYIHEFNTLVLILGERLTQWLVLYRFNKGLDAHLQREIAGKWTFDDTLQHLVNEATSAESRRQSLRLLGGRTAQGTRLQPQPAVSYSSGSGPAPMELNVAHASSTDDRCWKCNRRGHWANECPADRHGHRPAAAAQRQQGGLQGRGRGRQYGGPQGRGQCQGGGRKPQQGAEPGGWKPRKN